MQLLLGLLQLLTIPLPCIAGDASQLVYDTEGHELTSESEYYVLPAKHAGGGGLKYNPTLIGCLNLVVQERNETLLSTPVQFTPQNASVGGAVCLSSDVWIEFYDLPSICAKFLDWHLTEHSPESSSGQLPYVAAGTADVSRSFKVFRVERHDAHKMGYKLVSCDEKGPCKDLGLHDYKDKTWLTVSDEPFVVVFKKA